MKILLRFAIIFSLVFVNIGCTSTPLRSHTPLNQSVEYYDYIQPTFSDYLDTTKAWLTENRAFITDDHKKEIAMNMPFELFPGTPTDKAILLVHGLGDSPYSFSDLAMTLKNQGFYVQTLLLPGHGSKPEDLMLPEYSDWQSIVDHYANLLKQSYDHVWLGGFSTGGNLVAIHTLEQGGIDGLVLVSPGFQSSVPVLEKFTPLASLFFDGYMTEEINLARYTSATLKGAMSYSNSASKLRHLLKKNTISVPTLIVVSEADSVINPDVIKSLYYEHFDNPHNKLIWYGEKKYESTQDKIITRTMHIDTLKISTGSHMSPLFSPWNPYYGKQGEMKMCSIRLDDEDKAKCYLSDEVWYGAAGYSEEDKIYARLTWNPYYTELEESLQELTSKKTISRIY